MTTTINLNQLTTGFRRPGSRAKTKSVYTEEDLFGQAGDAKEGVESFTEESEERRRGKGTKDV